MGQLCVPHAILENTGTHREEQMARKAASARKPAGGVKPAPAAQVAATYGASRGRRGRTGERGEPGKSIVGPPGNDGKRGLPGFNGKSIVGPRGERGPAGNDNVYKWVIALFLLTQAEVLALYLWWLSQVP